MLGNLGLVLAAATISIFGEVMPPDTQEESSMLFNLNDFMAEVMAIPTGVEFLNLMHGQIKAIAPFAKQIGPKFHQDFTQLETDYVSYKTLPNTTNAQELWKDLQLLISNADVNKSYSNDEAMRQSLNDFHQVITSDLNDLTNDVLWQMVGQLDIIDEFKVDINQVVKNNFELIFDKLTDDFNSFVNELAEANQKLVIADVEKLQSCLTPPSL